jgi:hypothetical protein
MRRRRVIVGLVVLAMVAVVAVIVWPRGPRPCRETFDQVRAGMTRDEVIATVGRSPDYLFGQYWGWPQKEFADGRDSGAGWYTAEATYQVWFDRDGGACAVEALPANPDRPSDWDRFIDRLRARLGL